jgi:hypothetical protein
MQIFMRQTLLKNFNKGSHICHWFHDADKKMHTACLLLGVVVQNQAKRGREAVLHERGETGNQYLLRTVTSR